MSALIRLAILAGLAALVFAAVRAYLRSTGRAPDRKAEPEVPYCLKCESTRNVVVNSGIGPLGARWYCTKCREGF
jgi:hypothetical protein